MREIIEIEEGSYYTYLPEGCEICRDGGKLVLFLTGECVHSCYYCPISEERKGKDVMFANEREVKSLEDIEKEIELMSAEGAGITGGEPLAKQKRLLEVLKFLKEFDMHIHIYTSIPAGWRTIEKIADYTDEIRFHPVGLENAEKFIDSIRYAKELGIDAGFEIPALYFKPDIAEIANSLDCFVNLNELEFSHTNYEKLIERGYKVDEFYGSIGSDEIADSYLRVVRKFHYCTATFKDAVQFRRRLLRMALNHPEMYDVLEDGTIMCGLLKGDGEKIQKAIDFLTMVSEEYVRISDIEVEIRTETARRYLNKFKEIGLEVSIIERYPTSKRIIVEVEPL
ncbi:putative conserved protein related to pyruvate formate-lyase activating enzyme [Archaeoglobus sulfaticallidus PM70-1]|uniref:Putative conserved protein related to pyruvate formate-lyase activating enzyme n=1 Tax=Archaeoglobus sulfaticallidus PM70-1 TaxID=387631 RepID=N0BE86_9EURY|nr:radical SAM protein [Archaeoglobus sulfaticallidus]AGK60527.1 putative conserved protein related to pyruvate formate-lyase activating enzyme [Archaeoglobus sulfaticallidus PM70-1]